MFRHVGCVTHKTTCLLAVVCVTVRECDVQNVCVHVCVLQGLSSIFGPRSFPVSFPLPFSSPLLCYSPTVSLLISPSVSSASPQHITDSVLKAFPRFRLRVCVFSYPPHKLIIFIIPAVVLQTAGRGFVLKAFIVLSRALRIESLLAAPGDVNVVLHHSEELSRLRNLMPFLKISCVWYFRWKFHVLDSVHLQPSFTVCSLSPLFLPFSSVLVTISLFLPFLFPFKLIWIYLIP